MSYPYEPDYVVAPGETLREWFEYTNVPQRVAWRLYGLPEDVLAGVLAGTTEILPEIAEKLERLTFIPARFWLALEHNFRVGLSAGKQWAGAPTAPSVE